MYAQALLLLCAFTAVVSARSKGHITIDIDKLQQDELHSLSRSPAPRYVESLELMSRNAEALRNLLPHEPLNVADPRRHYVLIVGVLACVVEYLNSDCTPPDYEHEYLPTVDTILPIVWQDPRLAVSKVEGFLVDINDTVHQIDQIVKSHCVDLKPTVCDRVIEAIASDSDELDDALKLLLLVGDLAAIYEKNRYDKDAAKFNAVPLLLNGQKTLKPLIFKAAEIYNKVYGSHCEP